MNLQISAWPPGAVDKYRRLADELVRLDGGLTFQVAATLRRVAQASDLAGFPTEESSVFIDQVTAGFEVAPSEFRTDDGELAGPFIGQWVKCIRDGEHSRSFVVDVYPDGTAREAHLFDPSGESWPMGWRSARIPGKVPIVEFWGDFEHGYYRSEVIPESFNVWRGEETAHHPGDSSSEPRWVTQVAFIRR